MLLKHFYKVYFVARSALVSAYKVYLSCMHCEKGLKVQTLVLYLKHKTQRVQFGAKLLKASINSTKLTVVEV